MQGIQNIVNCITGKNNTNKSLSKIVKIVILSGLIEICGLIITIVLGNVQQNTYEAVIQNEFRIEQNINAVISNSYQLQTIATNYQSAKNISEDYQQEVQQIENDTATYLETLSSNKLTVKDPAIKDRISNLEVHYRTLYNYVDSVINRKKVTDNIDILINNDTNEIQNLSVIIQMYNNTQKEKQTSYIKNLNIVAKVVDLCVLVIAISSVLICMYIADKNALQMAEQQAIAEEKAKINQKKSYTDVLTGLWNRKYTELAVTQYIKIGQKGCLFIMDMDNFKSVNDIYGHRAGDSVIIEFANVIKKCARSNDICCRLGGDEFMIFAKDITQDQAFHLADRIAESTKKEMIKLQGGNQITVSMGAAMLDNKIISFQQLYEMADKELYYIKEHGKSGFKML